MSSKSALQYSALQRSVQQAFWVGVGGALSPLWWPWFHYVRKEKIVLVLPGSSLIKQALTGRTGRASMTATQWEQNRVCVVFPTTDCCVFGDRSRQINQPAAFTAPLLICCKQVVGILTLNWWSDGFFYCVTGNNERQKMAVATVMMLVINLSLR